jgi:hypothetical protein
MASIVALNELLTPPGAPVTTGGGHQRAEQRAGQAQVAANVTAKGASATATEYSTGQIVLWSSLAAIIAAVLFLGVTAGITRHVGYMKEHPWKFVVELLFVTCVCPMPIFFAAWLRGTSLLRALVDYAFLAAKFAGIWILFELSGANELIFLRT